MAFDVRALAASAALVGCGVAGATAARGGMWGLLAGALLTAVWIGVADWFRIRRVRAPLPSPAPVPHDLTAHRLLLDAAPTPLVAIDHASVRALNRAARRLFATDGRILTAPPALTDGEAAHIRYEGRSWRVDRVSLGDAGVVAALIDIEQEERTAEARATAELIHVLGHELLNGLAPIASLADSGAAAIDRPAPDLALLREIFATLARRAEGLLRFTEAYRSLARLPEPSPRPVPLDALGGDLARLFAGRWPTTPLTVDIDREAYWALDRDQVTQALWALLQNAAEACEGPDARVALRMAVDGEMLLIDIEDNGPGIPPERAAHIFRPFHTSKAEGTGVGLSLARQIALAHGGTLSLVPGATTLFRMTLPGASNGNP